MRISNEGEDFPSENFGIYSFYDETLLLAWHGDRLKVFRYDGDLASALNPRLLLAPGEVKNVKSYDQRIFITCCPYGVYKLSKNYQFALLSSTGIGIGARFYQVLRIDEDKYISLGDKHARTSTLLFKHDPIDGAAPCMVGLIRENVDDELLNVLVGGDMDQNELCIFSYGYEIYTIVQDTVKIIHNSHCLVTNIVEVKLNEKLMFLLYLTNKPSALLMYAHNDELVFEKMELNQKVKTAYACVDKMAENIIWIIHSDGNRTYRSRKILAKHSIQSEELSTRNITCLQEHNGEIIGLSSLGELVKVDPRIDDNPIQTKDDDFIKLKLEMLQGTESIVESICEKVKELQSIDNDLLSQQDELKRINMVTCEQDISAATKVRVHKIAEKTVLSCKFGYGIPEKCQLTFSVRSNGRKIFATKRVTEKETNIELPFPDSVSSDISNITNDLITLSDEGYSWCLIKNCIKDTGDNNVRTQPSNHDKTNFVNAKLAALQNLKKADVLEIDKLNTIKNSMRKEFNVI